MKKLVSIVVFAAALSLSLSAQDRNVNADQASTAVGRSIGPVEGTGTPGHPFTVTIYCGRESVAKEECESVGDVKYAYEGHNLRTSAGTTWQFNQMAGTPQLVGTYLALTADSAEAAEGDTQLATEITGNGLARALATVTNASGALVTPTNFTAVSTVGTAGAATYWYAVAAGNQGIYGAPTSGVQITTGNATLSSANYITGTFTPVAGASAYQVLRNTSNSFSGTASILTSAQVSCTATTCTFNDISPTLTSVTVGANANTNYGKYTLVVNGTTWTATGTQSVWKYGVFGGTGVSGSANSGTLIFEGKLGSQVSLNATDTFTLTETVYF